MDFLLNLKIITQLLTPFLSNLSLQSLSHRQCARMSSLCYLKRISILWVVVLIDPCLYWTPMQKSLQRYWPWRLEKVIPTLISPDQTGFVKDRQLFFNIRWLLNVLYAPSPPGHKDVEAILSLDAEKAFDWVELDYVLRPLKCSNLVLNLSPG